MATSDMTIGVMLFTQLKYLQAAGYDVAAICSEGPYVKRVRSLGIPVHIVPMRRAITPLADLPSLARMAVMLRRLRPDIVHTHTPKAGLLGQYGALLAGVPRRVHTIHGLYFPDTMTKKTKPFYVAIERETVRFATAVLTVSPEDIPVAIEEGICAARKIEYLINGIDLRRYDPGTIPTVAIARARQELGLSDDDLVMGIAGRVNREKGYEEFFRAATILARRFSNLRLLVVGPIELEKGDASDPFALAERAGVASRLVYAGNRSDMPLMYSLMDVLTLPSHREGYPRSPMEAAAMGRPSVVTNIRGCRQTVIHGETGYIIPVGDHEALAASVGEILADGDLASKLGTAARNHAVANWDETRTFEQTVRLYQRLVGPSAPVLNS